MVEANNRSRNVKIQSRFAQNPVVDETLLPQRIAVFGLGSEAIPYLLEKVEVADHKEAGSIFGYGSPLHLAIQQLLPDSGDGVGAIPVTAYPLRITETAASAVASITPVGTPTTTGTVSFIFSEIQSEPVYILANDTVADITSKIFFAIAGVLDIPVLATDNTTIVDLVAKWEGVTGNNLDIVQVGSVDGLTFDIVQFEGGVGTPDIQQALEQVGSVWESLILNCHIFDETSITDDFAEWGEGQWAAKVAQPAVVFTGYDRQCVKVTPNPEPAGSGDRTNSRLSAPGSLNLPWVFAARQLARIAVVANATPADNYAQQSVDGINPGEDFNQWAFAMRDFAVANGYSTTTVLDGILFIDDIVTTTVPSNSEDPPYRYVSEIVKIQNILYNVARIFKTIEWDGAPLVPDDQETTEVTAKRPKMAVAEISALLDIFENNGLIVDASGAKQTITAAIDALNPKRLNIEYTVQISGSMHILDVTSDYFYLSSVAPAIDPEGFVGVPGPEVETVLELDQCPAVLFDDFPVSAGNSWGWGWSVQRLRFGYTGAPLRAYRESDGAEMDIPFGPGGHYADLDVLATFLNGSVGRCSVLYDQGPGGQFPNGDPVPSLDLDQEFDINKFLWLTDLSGNVFVNSAGILELGCVWAQGLPGASAGYGIRSSPVNLGSPAGSPDMILISATGRRTTDEKTAFNASGIMDIGWELETGNGDPQQNEDLVWDPPGDKVEFTQTNKFEPFILSGYVSDNTPKGLVYNGQSPIIGDISPQGQGGVRMVFGKNESNQHGFAGWMQEVWIYGEDATYLDAELIAKMHTSQMRSLGTPL